MPALPALGSLLSGLPTGDTASYDSCRDSYQFGKTLGAGTYGIVREADQNGQKYAVKIILKKNVRGNERMVYDELEMLQRMKHPHIVRFHDWFESRVCPPILQQRTEC